jgi:hypothetical protein
MPVNPSPLPGLLLAAVLFAVPFRGLSGDDLKALSGRMFYQAEVKGLTQTNVTLVHRGGTSQVPLSEFSLEDQKRLRDLDIRRRTAELEQLKQELDQRQTELEVLRSKPVPAATAAQPVAAPTSPTAEPPIANPPPLQSTTSSRAAVPAESDALVTVRDLVQAYTSDRDSADARFKGRRFQIRGFAQSFSSKAFLRAYTIRLDSGDPKIRVACQFSYRSDWKAVFPAEEGQRLEARIGSGQITLLEHGSEAVFLGTCEGLRDGAISFTGCHQESPPLPQKVSSR